MNDATVNRSDDLLVAVENLCVHFPIRKGVFGVVGGYVKAVDGVSLSVRQGEIFALVGESGCGKTTAARAIAGLLAPTSGSIILSFDKTVHGPIDWKKLDARTKRAIRRRMQLIFQDPFGSLDPRMTVKAILEEPLVIHGIGSRRERLSRIRELLEKVGLSQEYLNRYPHEFSGGQRQRIGIARALATEPQFIIADEPVSALDVSIQAQIINLLQDLRERYNQTLLFISHDLAVVRHLADRIAVMYMGKIVEYGTETELFLRPQHPYTILLLESVPVFGKERRRRTLQGAFRDFDRQKVEGGCDFFPRCPFRRDDCSLTSPNLRETATGRGVACFYPIGK